MTAEQFSYIPDRGRKSEQIQLTGRILYLTQDPALIRRQLEGENIPRVPEDQLLSNISTDAIIPNRACLTWTGKEEGHLGKYLLTGIAGGIIKPGEVAAGNFQAVVAGPSFARGSSRIHAPLAFQDAGINLIIAESERIFAENCVNLRIHLLDPESQQAQSLLEGKAVSDEDVLGLISPQSRDIMRSGSLLSYFKNIEDGSITIPENNPQKRPMTIAEKILAKKALNDGGKIGVTSVKPGDEIVAIPDTCYGYELQSNAMVRALRQQFGDNIQVRHPEKTFLYNDHTALLKDDATATLRHEQTVFAQPLNIQVYEANPTTGAPAICHTDMVANHALPGDLILGNDSHTCTVGVVNTLAIGKGALDLAGAIAYDKMVITVPETIRINMRGTLPKGVTMKDFMLQFGATSAIKNERIGSGRMFEFGGDAFHLIPFDEQTKLTNMSVELLGFSGVIEPNTQQIEYIMNQRGLSFEETTELMIFPDENAEYSHVFDIDLTTIEPTVATPGDTQNGVPLSEVEKQQIKITKAYIGSCTHGTVEDLKQAAEVMRGRKVKEGVTLYVQASSIDNQAHAKEHIQILVAAGAKLLPVGCGACMNAGEGSTEEGETAIFATNRNFPGRTGRGEAYLSSPAVAAASAVTGIICGPQALETN